MAKNPFGKSRKQDAPYAIYASHMGWEWRILKTYKQPANEAADLYARWFVAAKSPHTWGSFELGDTYRRDVIQHGRLVAATEEWAKAYRGLSLEELMLPSVDEYLKQNA